MALIKLTAIVDAISGKLNGTVFSRNKGGAYVRSRGVAVNPQTTAQSAVRSIFGSLSQAWRDLTDVQRNAWKSITADYPYQNSLGDAKILTGKALFQKLNGNRASLGLPLLPVPAPPGDVIAVSGPQTPANALAIDNTTSEVSFLYSLPQALTENNTYVLEATPPVSAGISSPPKNRFRRLSVKNNVAPPGNSVDSADFAFGGLGNTAIYNAYTVLFGVPATGSKVFFRIKAINQATGQASPYFAESTFVIES